jgi:hypothetical protein
MRDEVGLETLATIRLLTIVVVIPDTAEMIVTTVFESEKEIGALTTSEVRASAVEGEVSPAVILSLAIHATGSEATVAESSFGQLASGRVKRMITIPSPPRPADISSGSVPPPPPPKPLTPEPPLKSLVAVVEFNDVLLRRVDLLLPLPAE